MNRPTDPDWAALDVLRTRITGLDAQVAALLSQRNALVEQYERHRMAILNRAQTPGPLPAPPSQEWTGARVRAVTLGLGATLLAVSALTFTAVAWSRLGDAGRAALLLMATAVITALALALRRRLPMTAEAFAGLAIVLALVDLYAVRRTGLAEGMPWQLWWTAGVLVTAGFAAALGRVTGRRISRFGVAALLPVAPELVADLVGEREWAAALILAGLAALIGYAKTRWDGHLFQEARVVLGLHAIGSWLAAAVLAGLAASQADTVVAAVLPAGAVAALAVAPELTRRRLADPALRAGAAALTAGVPAGVLLTLASPVAGADVLKALAVAGGVATILATAYLGGAGFRVGGVAAGLLFALPGVLSALSVSLPAVLGPLEWLLEPWGGTVRVVARDAYLGPNTSSPLTGSWAVVASLGAIAAVAAALGFRRPWLFGIASATTSLVFSVAPLLAGSTVLIALGVTAAAAIAIGLAAAGLDRTRAGRGWGLLPGAAVVGAPVAGWAAVSPAASSVTLCVTTLAAGIAAAVARTGPARSLYAGLAAALFVTFAGVATKAAGAGSPVAGFAAVVAAGVVVLVGVYALRADQPTGSVLEGVGASAALAGVLAAADGRTCLAGALTVSSLFAVVAALRTDRRMAYGAAGGVLALGATWAWLAAAGVDVIEAYTAPAAGVALVAGILQWRTGPGRSWVTLGPALLLAIGPTLLLGMAADDAVRLVLAALLALAAVLAGGVLRLQAPLCLGAVALLALAVDQWGDDIVRMPRWITLGIIGVLLMWIGATFEHRRRDWRRTTEVVSRFG